MFNQDFYFQTIRKYVALFGTLFSEINITRTVDGEAVTYIRVPITYAQGEKMLGRVEQAANADNPAAITLPVMSFEMTGLTYDPDRKMTTVGRSSFPNYQTFSTLKYQYNPVPYDFAFDLNIWVKNAEDGTKIIEQILPYFTPEFTVQVILIPEVGVKAEIPVILHNITQTDPYESDFKKNQPIIWTLKFTLKGQLYGPVKTAPIILFSNTNSWVGNTTVFGEVGTLQVQPGQDANGNPTSNIAVSVPANSILVTSDWGYITTYSDEIPDPTNAIKVDQSPYVTIDTNIVKIR